MFLEFDISISHSVRDTFLSTGNEVAYKVRISLLNPDIHMQILLNAFIHFPRELVERICSKIKEFFLKLSSY